ncbi:MAG: hypothetical protein ACKOCD_07740 [Nitrospiraceae bacterium]
MTLEEALATNNDLKARLEQALRRIEELEAEIATLKKGRRRSKK